MATHAERSIGLRIRHRSSAASHGLRPPIGRRERTLVNEPDLAGNPIVATTAALYHRRNEGEPGSRWRRLPWEELCRVRWIPSSGLPAAGVLELAAFCGAPTRLRISAASRLPKVVQDLVATADLIGTRVPLDDGRFAVVSARRRSSGETIWVVRLPDGVAHDDPAVRAQIDAAIHGLRAQL